MALKPNRSALVVIVASVVAGCFEPSDAAPDLAIPAAAALESVPLVNHIQFGVFEMDVFVAREGEPGLVYRPTAADASDAGTRDAPLFRTATMTPHDPSFSQAGPFAMGTSLGLTLGDWLDGRGAIAYRCDNGVASLDAAFARLVPNGVYTIWYARLTLSSGAITGAAEYPLGAPDGSQNRFVADSQGTGSLSLAAFPCVEPTTVDGTGTGVATVFAAAYHSDGNVYGAVPGDFGRVTHVQLFGMAKALRQG